MTRRKSSRRRAWYCSKIDADDGETIREPIHDRRGQGGEFRRELPPRVAQVSQGEHDPRADDADANLDRAIDGEDEGEAARASDRPEGVDRDNRRRVTGERRGIGGEIAQ